VSKKELKRLSGDEHLYKHFHVKKKDKSLRPVDDPRRELKVVQRRVAELLASCRPTFCSALSNSGRMLGMPNSTVVAGSCTHSM
jgi:hypothetical protein